MSSFDKKIKLNMMFVVMTQLSATYFKSLKVDFHGVVPTKGCMEERETCFGKQSVVAAVKWKRFVVNKIENAQTLAMLLKQWCMFCNFSGMFVVRKYRDEENRCYRMK